jgi:D-arginine dehydrogenase
MLKPAAMDIDVDAVHQGFLRGIKARGGRVMRSARLRSLAKRGGCWQADTDTGEIHAGYVINATGAWADEVADLAGARPVGLTPLRRTAFIVASPRASDAGRWPMVNDVTETFYFKPESGRLLISPSDATPVPPGDARPDDLDVAAAIERVQAATTLEIRHVQRAWAGLRTATPDDTPVVGEARIRRASSGWPACRAMESRQHQPSASSPPRWRPASSLKLPSAMPALI